MEPVVAHTTWRTLEPIHAMIYFVPEAGAAYAEAGIGDARSGYFASRSAALGSASAELVIATFYNFHPPSVRVAMEGVWTTATPAQLLAARLGAADLALRRLLGDDVVTGAEVAEAAELARQAAVAATEHLEGRPLFAAHAALPWPDEAHLVLWHAQTLLREFRGDGHIAALVADDVSGVEALLMHGGTGAIAPALLQRSRNWPDDAWAEATDRLLARGYLDADGSLSELGSSRRRWVEDCTDSLAVPAYETLGAGGCDRLRALCRPLSRAIVDGGGVPV